MTKTVALADDAYAMLAAVKRPDESFSDVTRRLVQQVRRRDILHFSGRWKMTKREGDEFLRDVYAARDATLGPRAGSG